MQVLVVTHVLLPTGQRHFQTRAHKRQTYHPGTTFAYVKLNAACASGPMSDPTTCQYEGGGGKANSASCGEAPSQVIESRQIDGRRSKRARHAFHLHLQFVRHHHRIIILQATGSRLFFFICCMPPAPIFE